MGLSMPSPRNSRINNPNDDGCAAKCRQFITLTPEHFEKNLDTCSTQQALIEQFISQTPASITTMLRQHTVTPAQYSNVKYTEFSCKPIKPSSDGSKENLIPFLTRLDIRRQIKGWASATYIEIKSKPTNLTCHFA